MRIFFDRCAPLRLAKMVRILEGDIIVLVHHDEDPRFHQSTKDVEWLQALAGDGDPLWVVISGDGRILKNPAERQVLNEVGLPFICLDENWLSMAIHEYAWKFLEAWPGILDIAGRAKKGSVSRQRSGSSLKLEKI